MSALLVTLVLLVPPVGAPTPHEPGAAARRAAEAMRSWNRASVDATREAIDLTPHNLFGKGAHSKGEVDVCQLCHVPSHVASATRPQPAWSPRAHGRNAALEDLGDPTGPALSMRWAGSTLRCLSCHDGTISSINIAFRPASGSLQDDPIAGEARRGTSLAGPTLEKPLLYSSEVMGNHPVSVPYPLDGTGSEYRRWLARGVPIDPREWVGDPRQRGLRLVNDTAGADVLRGTAGVECVSCHDPHGTPNTYFLRLPKERSELCLACHRK
jgi:predicted CXXCH cytochrome family protein